MRHKRSINHLGRQAGHRKAMMANMAASLIMHKRIRTTTVKAKALRTYVEPLITKSKEDSTHSRRMVFSFLQSKEAVTELFREVSPKIASRPGGYTRILKTGTRLGDNADMCIIELVDFNDNLLVAKEEAASKTGRRKRRTTKKKDVTDQVASGSEIEAESTELTEKPKEKKAKKAEEVKSEATIETKSEVSEEVGEQEKEENTEEKKEE
jgi:large subunit ribosomal protein L17